VRVGLYEERSELTNPVLVGGLGPREWTDRWGPHTRFCRGCTRGESTGEMGSRGCRTGARIAVVHQTQMLGSAMASHSWSCATIRKIGTVFRRKKKKIGTCCAVASLTGGPPANNLAFFLAISSVWTLDWKVNRFLTISHRAKKAPNHWA
jgi:hypothetical protein